MYFDAREKENATTEEGESASESSVGMFSMDSVSTSKHVYRSGLFYKPNTPKSPAEALEKLLQRALDPNTQIQFIIDAITNLLAKNKHLINHTFSSKVNRDFKGLKLEQILCKPDFRESFKRQLSSVLSHLQPTHNIAYFAAYQPKSRPR